MSLRVVSISACAQPCPTSIAFHYIQRHALMADPKWNKGAYYRRSFPQTGMQLARFDATSIVHCAPTSSSSSSSPLFLLSNCRELGMITYRSGPEWDTRFGHKRQYPEDSPSFCPDFAIEWYLDKKVGLLRNDFVSLCKMCVCVHVCVCVCMCVCVCVCVPCHTREGRLETPTHFCTSLKYASCQLALSSLCDSL